LAGSINSMTLGSASSQILTDGTFLQPIGTGNNLTPWSDWTNAGVTTNAAPGGIPGNYASLPVGADLFQQFATLSPGEYALSFYVQNQSAWSDQLVFAVQQGGGTPANVLWSAGTEGLVNLSPDSGFQLETFNFTIGTNMPFTPDEFYFSNSYDYPQPGTPIANSVNQAGSIINVADVSIVQDSGSPVVNCFFKGTRILTSKGEDAIEDLSIGDDIVTIEGRSLPIKWIGRQRFSTPENGMWPLSILPVKISKGALDDQTPHRDLYLSPSHCLYVDGVLIPAMHLVNGSSIIRAMPEWAEDIEFFHVELETHEVVFAEGAAAETFLIHNEREAFDNSSEHLTLPRRDAKPQMKPFAPIASYNGGVSELDGLLRRAVSSVVDIRSPIQIAFDRISARSLELADQD